MSSTDRGIDGGSACFSDLYYATSKSNKSSLDRYLDKDPSRSIKLQYCCQHGLAYKFSRALVKHLCT